LECNLALHLLALLGRATSGFRGRLHESHIRHDGEEANGANRLRHGILEGASGGTTAAEALALAEDADFRHLQRIGADAKSQLANGLIFLLSVL